MLTEELLGQWQVHPTVPDHTARDDGLRDITAVPSWTLQFFFLSLKEGADRQAGRLMATVIGSGE